MTGLRLASALLLLALATAAYLVLPSPPEQESTAQPASGIEWPSTDDYDFLGEDDLFTISSMEEAEALRGEAIEIIWGSAGIDEIETSTSLAVKSEPAERLASIFDADVVELYWPDAPLGIDGEAYFLKRYQGARCLVVYNDGHHDGVSAGGDGSHRLINDAFDLGCDVVIFPSPVLGLHRETIEFDSDIGRFRYQASHRPFAFAPSPERGHGLRYMLDPLRLALNWAMREEEYDVVAMAGLSGGGWTTTVYTALDLRIDFSMSVAGSIPVNMRALDYRSWGDWEQTAEGFFDRVRYGDLYLLTAIGDGRGAIHAYIFNDTCCFGGDAGLVIKRFAEARAQKLNADLVVTVDREVTGHGLVADFADQFRNRLQAYLERD